MARPWEDTIVIALRDAQWMDLPPTTENAVGARTAVPPPLFVKLDDDAEQSLGDLLYQAGERFFLFEVKSAAGRISSEWSKTPKKRLFLSLKQFAESKMTPGTKISPESAQTASEAKSDAFVQALWSSLRCHHFVYWAEQVHDTSDTLGNIFLEPYLRACFRGGAIQCATLEGVQMFELIEEGALSASNCAPFSCIRNKTGFVGDVSSGIENGILVPLGEDLDRFREYVAFLVAAGGGGGEIRAVILSDHGFIKVVKSFAELAQQLVKTNRPHPPLVPAKDRTVYQVSARMIARLKEMNAHPVQANRPSFPPPTPPAPKLTPRLGS